MKLGKKKELITRTLGVGKGRIILNKERLDEIKNAITRQDIRDLINDKAMVIKNIKGKRKIVKRKTRRRAGSVKNKVNNSKKEYMMITRKLRAYIRELKKQNVINAEQYWKLRKQIKARYFKSKSNLKESVALMLKGDK